MDAGARQAMGLGSMALQTCNCQLLDHSCSVMEKSYLNENSSRNCNSQAYLTGDSFIRISPIFHCAKVPKL